MSKALKLSDSDIGLPTEDHLCPKVYEIYVKSKPLLESEERDSALVFITVEGTRHKVFGLLKKDVDEETLARIPGYEAKTARKSLESFQTYAVFYDVAHFEPASRKVRRPLK